MQRPQTGGMSRKYTIHTLKGVGLTAVKFTTVKTEGKEVVTKHRLPPRKLILFTGWHGLGVLVHVGVSDALCVKQNIVASNLEDGCIPVQPEQVRLELGARQIEKRD